MSQRNASGRRNMRTREAEKTTIHQKKASSSPAPLIKKPKKEAPSEYSTPVVARGKAREPLKNRKRDVHNLLEMQKKYPDLAPYKLEQENSFSFGSAKNMRKNVFYQDEDEESECGDEEEEEEEENDDDSGGEEDTHLLDKSSRQADFDARFSIYKHLGNSSQDEDIFSKLKKAIEIGSVQRIGSLIRQGISKNQFTELQLEEWMLTVDRPNISLFRYFTEFEEATEHERRDISMGQMFLTKMALGDSKSVNKLKASVNSLAASFVNQTAVALLTKRTLLRNHMSPPIGSFPSINLVEMYNKHNLIGDNAYSQMTHFLMKVFKTALNPSFHIWKYTYRPKSVRPCDKHFVVFPDQVAEALIDFAFDLVGIYLPDDLLHGPISPTHPFLEEITGTNPTKEIERRREEREKVAQTMQSSIGQMLNYLRDYHFDVETEKMESCKTRKTCTKHITWRDLKVFREDSNDAKTSAEDVPFDKLIGYASKKSNGNGQGQF